MANDLTITQLSTILNSIMTQATGRGPIAINNTADFVNVGQTALKAGYDNLLGAISQVMGRTVFSIRPYTRKFRSLSVSRQQYGNMTRKLNISDADWENDGHLELADGDSVDMYKVKKPNILQLNFYGMNVYERHITLFKDQLDAAFRGPDDFAAFVTMYMQNTTDVIEQTHENLSRAIIGNAIGGKIASGDNVSVIDVITEYNKVSGTSLTMADIFKPDNFFSFAQWLSGFIKGIRSMLTERTVMYHTNVTGKEIARHTPLNEQLGYIYAPVLFEIDARSKSNTYHNALVDIAGFEPVNFWQSAQDKQSLNVTPVYLEQTGALAKSPTPIEINDLLGVIFDREMMGYTIVNEWVASSPFNAKGGYSNTFFHFTDQWWNDFTENCVILRLR